MPTTTVKQHTCTPLREVNRLREDNGEQPVTIRPYDGWDDGNWTLETEGAEVVSIEWCPFCGESLAG